MRLERDQPVCMLLLIGHRRNGVRTRNNLDTASQRCVLPAAENTADDVFHAVDRSGRRARVAPQHDGAARKAGEAFCLRRSEEHTSELQSLMRISYAVFCLRKKKL